MSGGLFEVRYLSDPEAAGILPRVVVDIGGKQAPGERRPLEGNEKRTIDLEGRRADREAPHPHLVRRARPRTFVVHLEGSLLHRFFDAVGLDAAAPLRLESDEPVELLLGGEVDHWEDEPFVVVARLALTAEDLVGHAIEIADVGGSAIRHGHENLVGGLGHERRDERAAPPVTAELDTLGQLGSRELAHAVDIELRLLARHAPVHKHVEHSGGEKAVRRTFRDLGLPAVLREEGDVVLRVTGRVRGDLLDPLELARAGFVGPREPRLLLTRDRCVDPVRPDDVTRGIEGRDGRVTAGPNTLCISHFETCSSCTLHSAHISASYGTCAIPSPFFRTIRTSR